MVLGVGCSDLILHVEPIKAVAIEQVLTLIALQLTVRDNARKYLPQSPQAIFTMTASVDLSMEVKRQHVNSLPSYSFS